MPRDVAQARGGLDQRLHRVPGSHVDTGHAHVESGIAKCLGGQSGILFMQAGEQHMLARTYTPRNGLADRTGPHDHDYIFHLMLLRIDSIHGLNCRR